MNASVFVQVQLLMGALSALLPLAPEAMREKLAAVLDLAAQALRLTQAAARERDDLAEKLRRIRADIEAIVASGAAITPTRFDEAFARVQAASASFRAALEKAS